MADIWSILKAIQTFKSLVRHLVILGDRGADIILTHGKVKMGQKKKTQ